MPLPRVITAADSLESGFRGAHNDTAKAVGISGDVTDALLLRFYGLDNVFLFQIDLSPYVAKRSLIPPTNNGQPIVFSSATDDKEGTLRIGTLAEVIAGTNEFVVITPATLKYMLDTLAIAPATGTGTGTTTPAVTPTLAQVTTVGGITEHNIIFNNNSNPIISLASGAAQGGVYLFAPNPDGTFPLVGSMLSIAEGHITLNNGVWGKAFEFDKKDAYLNTERLLMPVTSVVLSDIQRTKLPAASKAAIGLWGPQPDATTGQSPDVLYSAKQVVDFIRAELDTYLKSKNLSSNTSSPGPVGTIYCRPTPTTTPTTTPGSGITEKFFSVTAAQLGTAMTHNLGVPGSQIWPGMITADGGDARAYVKIAFPTNNTFTITARNPETAADTNFIVKINLRVIPQ